MRLLPCLLFLCLFANDCIAVEREPADRSGFADSRVRIILGIPAAKTLDEAGFRDAVLEHFPLGTTWAVANEKIRKLVSPDRVTQDRRPSINLHNQARNISCNVSEISYFMDCGVQSAPEVAAISLDDRSWHFQMRFGVNKTLENVHTGSTPVQCWRDNNPSGACLKRATDDCRSKGGVWYGHVMGRGRDTGCNLPTRDAGKLCTNKSQCEGACKPVDEHAGGVRCACDQWTWQPKGVLKFCTESGVQSIHAE